MLISGPKKYAGCLILFEIIRVGPMEEFIFKQHKYHIPQQINMEIIPNYCWKKNIYVLFRHHFWYSILICVTKFKKQSSLSWSFIEHDIIFAKQYYKLQEWKFKNI